MIPNPTRHAATATTPITMPAMAPEDRREDDLEAVGLSNGLDSDEDDSEALGLLEGLDTSEDEDVVPSTPDQQMTSRLWNTSIPFNEIVEEVLKTLLKGVACRLLEDVDEDSTAFASAIETFAFALAKFVTQVLI